MPWNCLSAVFFGAKLWGFQLHDIHISRNAVLGVSSPGGISGKLRSGFQAAISASFGCELAAIKTAGVGVGDIAADFFVNEHER